MLDYLRRHGVTVLYHFTDIDNLPLIARHGGLLSKDALERKGLLQQVRTGGNTLSKDLDVRYGNWDKVSLSFCPRLPMAWHREQRQHLCYILVKVDVCCRHGVFFTDTNATKSDHMRGQGVEGLRLVDLHAVMARWIADKEESKRKRQAEILAPEGVTIGEMQSVVFRSGSSLEEGTRLWGSGPRPDFKVDPALFILSSAYAERHLLTADVVTREKAEAWSLADRRAFRRTPDVQLAVVVALYAPAETEEEFIWRTDSGMTIIRGGMRFETAGKRKSWCPVDASRFAAGGYSVDLVLGGIRQFNLPFRIAG